MKKNLKKGSTLLTTPIVIAVSLVFMVIISIYLFNLITPFIWFEKLNTIALKYMFVIERYGYLTVSEEDNLKLELKKEGFDIANIKIKAPKNKKTYGELVEFEMSYKLSDEYIKIVNNNLGINNKDIIINIKKNSFSKI